MCETEQYFSPTIEVNGVPKQPDYKLSSKYLPLCSEQTHSYRFDLLEGVNDDYFHFWVYCLFKKLLSEQSDS